MDPLTLLLIGISIAVGGIAAADFRYTHRKWVGLWRGHRVCVRHHRAKLFVEIDGEVALEQSRLRLSSRYAQPWSHPALGDTEVRVVSRADQNGRVSEMCLEIGDELVPLVALPRNWHGRLLPGAAEDYYAKLAPGEVESLGDARWVAACRMLDLVRESSCTSEEVRSAANLLQTELRKRFEARRRLADDASLALGTHAHELAGLAAKLEQNIAEALEALKSLHMATISLEAHADERPEMERVAEVIAHLSAEQEVMESLAMWAREVEESGVALSEVAPHEAVEAEAHIEAHPRGER